MKSINNLFETLTNQQIQDLYSILNGNNNSYNIYPNHSKSLLPILLRIESSFNLATKEERVSESILFNNLMAIYSEEILKKEPNRELINYILSISDLSFNDSITLQTSEDSHSSSVEPLVKYFGTLVKIRPNQVIFNYSWVSTFERKELFYKFFDEFLPNEIFFFDKIMDELSIVKKDVITQHDIVETLLKNQNNEFLILFINHFLGYQDNPIENEYLKFVSFITNKSEQINLYESLHKSLKNKQEENNDTGLIKI